MEETYSGNKRSRGNADESPEAKRLHADLLLFGILEDDDLAAGDRVPANQELEIVMKSLEEEIGLPEPSPATATAEEIGGDRRMEIGYLLEASDDELGLPPAGQWPPEEEEAAEGFGRIWGFEEDGMMQGWYEGSSEFVNLPEERFGAAEDGGAGFAAYFDAALFDLPDFYLRPESLPAL